MNAGIAVSILVTLVVLVVLIFVWVGVSRTHYTTRKLQPGEAYTLAQREYIMPNVPVYGEAFLLKDEYVVTLRSLVENLTAILREQNIDAWLTGGSLLGAMRHGAIPMPHDDDADVGVDVKHLDYMYSDAFVQLCKQKGLKVIYLLYNGARNADVHGSAVRVQSLDRSLPFSHLATLDIFFWSKSGESVDKLDGWFTTKTGERTLVRNKLEHFHVHDVFPLQKNVYVDGIIVNLPAKPRRVLEQQYSSRVWDAVIARSLFISHSSAYSFTQPFWTQQSAT
jgi:hypothetical protein